MVSTDLSYNQIVTLRDSSFTRSFNLKKLNLEGNNILDVTNQTFTGLGKLQILNLRKNEIVSLPAGVFSSNVPSLVDLDLSGNRITEIRTGVFDGGFLGKIVYLFIVRTFLYIPFNFRPLSLKYAELS